MEKEEAQINFDLKKELGFKDEYFENKINYLFGIILMRTIKIFLKKLFLDFHLAHKTNPNFEFEPKENHK